MLSVYKKIQHKAIFLITKKTVRNATIIFDEHTLNSKFLAVLLVSFYLHSPEIL
jgi:hypothetical protein